MENESLDYKRITHGVLELENFCLKTVSAGASFHVFFCQLSHKSDYLTSEYEAEMWSLRKHKITNRFNIEQYDNF